MYTILQDLRYGARVFLKNPGFTLLAVLTLALGIGVNTAIFSAVSSFMLRPSPYERQQELVVAFTRPQHATRFFGDFSYLNYLDYRDRNQVFDGLIAYRMISAAVSNTTAASTDRAEVVWGESVSGNYFDMLGRSPVHGRGFRAEEDVTPNTHPVVVLGHTLWQRRFSSDPAIIGKTIALNGHSLTVIGIAPADFTGTKFPLRMEFWVPLMMRTQLLNSDSWRTDRGQDTFTIMGRLKPGLSVAQAESDLNVIALDLERTYPKANEGIRVRAVSENEGRLSDAFSVLRLTSVSAMLVVGLVLLIACANVANLLLSRAAARSREIGIRLSLGAGRLRIVRQLLTESIMLSVAGGLLGLLLAMWSADVLNATVPPMPFVVDINFAPDRLTLWWATGLSVVTGIIFGLAPAMHAARSDLVSINKSGSNGSSTAGGPLNLRSLLLVGQFAISLVVLICAGLFLRSLRNAQATDTGMNVENLVSMQLDPELLGYTEESGRRFFSELVPRVAGLPGVASATVMQVMPLSDNSYSTGPLIKEGDAPPAPNQGRYVNFSSIGLRYFETMGTRLLLGRDFTEHDDAQAPQVVVINEELARRLYGSSEEAMGKRFYLVSTDRAPIEIVGIAADGKYRNLYEPPRAYMFLPHRQRFYYSSVLLAVRAKSAAALESVAELTRQEVQKMDARLPVFDLKMAEQHLSWAFWGPRLGASLSLTFAVLALMLATSGLYGVMSYAVSRRTKEVGIRMALGAQARDVLVLIVRQGMLMVAVGMTLGLVASFALGTVVVDLLLNVGGTDPLTFATATALLLLTAVAACWVPARRATRIEPLTALRHE